ncbi:MAG TPA: hypothetical protein VF267_05735, partial [Gammaproteobacteria bacterium]
MNHHSLLRPRIVLAVLFAFGAPVLAANAAPETLLANTIRALQDGEPDDTTMTPSMAGDIRPQVAALQESLGALGAVAAIRRDTAFTSGQHFIVDHANGATRWNLVLDEAGRIAGLWYWNLAPRFELQRQIRALGEGRPDYANMTAAMAEAIRPQAADLRQSMTELGPVISVVQESAEIFLVQHGNGMARWRIYLDADHKVSGLWVKRLPREQPAAVADSQPAPEEDDGGGFFSFLSGVVEIAAVVSDTSGASYNNYIARNVPALSG